MFEALTSRYKPLDGSCTCKGWPLGTDPKRAAQPRAERCQAMAGSAASSCDTTCKAQGYAIGLFSSFGSC